MSKILSGLTLPLKYDSGSIVDGTGKTVIKANRDSNTAVIPPAARDCLLKLTCELLNEAFAHDKADQIIKNLGY